MSYQDRAKNVLDCLLNQNLGDYPIAFICHSLGGIIVKQALRVAQQNQRFHQVFRATRCVCFIATPHNGSGVASLLRWLRLGSEETSQLGVDDPALRDLNEWYRNEWYRAAALANHIETAAYSETQSTGGLSIVDPLRCPGRFGVYGGPNRANHISIVKPGQSSMQVCESVSRFLRETTLLQ